MKFSQLALYLQKLEDTTKRLEITSILTDLIKNLSPDEVDKGIYLSLGYLAAEFESEKFNIAEKMMIKVLAQAYETSTAEIQKLYSESGDLGSVTESLAKKNKKFELNVNQVHAKLLEIAKITGNGSQERKTTTSAQLLRLADSASAKYIVRIILSTVRLGFTELTVIEALVQTINGAKDKEIKRKIEDKYRIHPDIGLIAKKIKEKGLAGLKNVTLEVGVPVHAQKAQRLETVSEVVEKMGEVWVEYKFDGTRVQLHLDKSKKAKDSASQQEMFDEETFGKKSTFLIKTFTRNLEETTHQFPDIVEAAAKQIKAESVILDGEAVGYSKKTGEFLPFQETIQRKRKYGVTEFAQQIPLKYMVFDILYLNGKSLVDEPLAKRREILNSIIKGAKHTEGNFDEGSSIEIDSHLQTSNADEISQFWGKALEKGLEGIMIKKINSSYEAGARNFTWVKMKKSSEQILSDTVDCVILGYYHGRGGRAKFGIGGFLVAVWDEKENKFKTLTKVGSGLKDDEWIELKKAADKISTKEKPTNADINQKYNCDVWTRPKIVVEIAADEISKSTDHSVGYALRFPRLIKFRTDKSPTDTTTPQEIAQMYKNQ